MVRMFKVIHANQILFLKNKLKDIKKGKDEDIQSYFLRITEIKNDLLSIGEVIPDRLLSPPLEDSHLSGIYLEPPSSTMIEFQGLKN